MLSGVRVQIAVLKPDSEDPFTSSRDDLMMDFVVDMAAPINQFDVNLARTRLGNAVYLDPWDPENGTEIMARQFYFSPASRVNDDPCHAFDKTPTTSMLYASYFNDYGYMEPCDDCCPTFGPGEHSINDKDSGEFESHALGSCVYCPNAMNPCQSIANVSEDCQRDNIFANRLNKAGDSICKGKDPPKEWQERYRALRGVYEIGEIETPWHASTDLNDEFELICDLNDRTTISGGVLLLIDYCGIS